MYEKLKEMIEAKGYTIASFEREAGIGNGAIGKNHHKDYNPRIRTLEKIANTLGIKPSTLVKKLLN